jgi:hypothetical protein
MVYSLDNIVVCAEKKIAVYMSKMRERMQVVIIADHAQHTH